MARILVADDAPAVLDVLEDILSREGHDVVRAATGTEAIERFQAGRPRLVVLDVIMPDLDGFALLDAIRRIDDKVPVILISGLSSEDIGRKAERYESVVFFAKGSGLDQFVELVNKTLGAPDTAGT